jgi:glycolate oxidase FAD binding subunit
MDGDITAELVERVREASARREPLRIVAGDTKGFIGRPVHGAPISLAAHAGVVNYDPSELVLTARAGTPLAAVETLLAAQGQCLPFEPPHFGAGATLGGTVACGLAGPARAWSGPLRDYVLGLRLLTGDGRVLRFGGEVMKNVAGYDVARLMAGSLGTLGILLDVSLKVLPLAPGSRTVVLELGQGAALERLRELSGATVPISASAWVDGRLYLRLVGTRATLDVAQRRATGEPLEGADEFWASVREQTHAFFRDGRPLWRLTLPALAAPLPIGDEPLVEWNGMQRWYRVGPEENLFARVAASEGHATAFRRAPAGAEVFAPLAAPVARLHRALKAVFDPAGILNSGRMYANL